jgi:hypothetical protein
MGSGFSGRRRRVALALGAAMIGLLSALLLAEL